MKTAYGGPGWSPRTASLQDEIGQVWGACGVSDEWSPLRGVLLHRPGAELEDIANPEAVQMLARPDPARARQQHAALEATYRRAGVRVYRVEPIGVPPPNQMFVADLFWMTPEGAVLARPASTVRAGEERRVAERLAALGVPILRSVRGGGTFEGADALWLGPRAVLLACGQRTNQAGADQVAGLLLELGVEVERVELPPGTMHLMGALRFLDERRALSWPGRLPATATAVLRRRGFEVLEIPDDLEASDGLALNFVTLGPGRILMPDGNPRTRVFLEAAGVEVHSVAIDELARAAGGIGCLTGVLERETPQAR